MDTLFISMQSLYNIHAYATALLFMHKIRGLIIVDCPTLQRLIAKIESELEIQPDTSHINVKVNSINIIHRTLTQLYFHAKLCNEFIISEQMYNKFKAIYVWSTKMTCIMLTEA